jgi:hypothetical protein
MDGRTDGRRTLTHDKSSHGLWPGELTIAVTYLTIAVTYLTIAVTFLTIAVTYLTIAVTF